MASVTDWSHQQGYHYPCIGDKLFDWVTPGLRAKLQDRKPILAYFVRLRGLNRNWRCAADWWCGSMPKHWS